MPALPGRVVSWCSTVGGDRSTVHGVEGVTHAPELHAGARRQQLCPRVHGASRHVCGLNPTSVTVNTCRFRPCFRCNVQRLKARAMCGTAKAAIATSDLEVTVTAEADAAVPTAEAAVTVTTIETLTDTSSSGTSSAASTNWTYNSSSSTTATTSSSHTTCNKACHR